MSHNSPFDGFDPFSHANSILDRKQSSEEAPPKKKNPKEAKGSLLRWTIGMLERKLVGVKASKEGPHTAGAIRNLESRLKRTRYELAELEASE